MQSVPWISDRSHASPDVNKAETPAWMHIPVLITWIAALAFLWAYLYVAVLSQILNFPLANYLDFSDYFQVIPIHFSIWSGLVNEAPIVLAVIVGVVILLPVIRLGWTVIGSHSLWVRRIDITIRSDPSIGATLRVVRACTPTIVLAFLFGTVIGGAQALAIALKQGEPTKVFLKGDQLPVVGKPFSLGSKYIMILTDQDTTITLIPQADVKMIQRRWRPTMDSTARTTVSASPSPSSSNTPDKR